MAQVQLGAVSFLDNVRLSSYAMELSDPTGQRGEIPGATVEDVRAFSIPGLYSEDPMTWDCYLPQNNDGQRLFELKKNSAEVLISNGDGTTLGDEFRVTKGYLLSGGWNRPDSRTMIQGSASVSDPHHHELGALRFFNTAVTAAVDGTAFQVTGGIPAGSQMNINVHPFAKTAGAHTLDCRLRSASDSGFTADLTTHVTFTQMSSSNGGVALRGDAQRGTIDGDSGAVTNTYFRFEVTAVSGGTWGLAVTVAAFAK